MGVTPSAEVIVVASSTKSDETIFRTNLTDLTMAIREHGVTGCAMIILALPCATTKAVQSSRPQLMAGGETCDVRRDASPVNAEMSAQERLFEVSWLRKGRSLDFPYFRC